MSSELTAELITPDLLLNRVRGVRQRGCRLVQISAVLEKEANSIALLYSFDLEGALTHFRLHLPAVNAEVPSITPVFWSAFLYENELHDLFHVQVKGIAVDFHGTLYKTAVKFPFGSTKPPVPNVHPAASAAPISNGACSSTASTPAL